MNEHVDLALANDKWRQHFHHVHGMPGHLRENAVFAKHLCHDHLCEENLVDLVQDLPSHLEFKLLWHPVRPFYDSNEKSSRAAFAVSRTRTVRGDSARNKF